MDPELEMAVLEGGFVWDGVGLQLSLIDENRGCVCLTKKLDLCTILDLPRRHERKPFRRFFLEAPGSSGLAQEAESTCTVRLHLKVVLLWPGPTTYPWVDQKTSEVHLNWMAAWMS